MDKITLLFYGKNHTILQQYDQHRRTWGSWWAYLHKETSKPLKLK